MHMRDISEIRRAQPSRDGDGVAIQRIAGMGHAGMDPFLLLDELRSDQRQDFVGGFPPHPHRGMQTVTYLKQGGIIHEDSQGNRGEIRGGGVQWMSAGRGVIHSEMPTVDTHGLHGFQLWVNLPRAEKMSAPRYRDIPGAELPAYDGEGFSAVAIAGGWVIDRHGLQGPLAELEPRAALLDLRLAPDAAVTVESPGDEALLGYVYQGSLDGGGTAVKARQLAVTGPGDAWTLRAGEGGAELLLLRGRPLREPVAHYGPFVMNTTAEIEQALRDYQSGRFA